MLKKLPEALRAMASLNQWVLWRPEKKPNTTKLNKITVNPRTGGNIDAHSPDAWLSIDRAEALAAGTNYFIGFTFTEVDPFFFIDVDDCLVNGQWSDQAVWVLKQFPGAAVEISISGAGLHVFGTYSQATPHGCDNHDIKASVYTARRFVALTGWNITGDAGTDHTGALNALVSTYYPPAAGSDPDEWTEGPCPEWNGITDDAKLIAKALKSKSTAGLFRSKATFKQLWEADADALAKHFPHPEGVNAWDMSQADSALAYHLAFWTGKDNERTRKLMLESGLNREKWDDRPDYLATTIAKAAAVSKEVYTRGPLRELAKTATIKAPDVSTGYQFLDTELQLKHFAGCVYIQDVHRIFTPSGALLKSEQFNATYGGYVFKMDSYDKETRRAWEAFTESQLIKWPKVNSSCFRPTEPPGAIIEEEDQSLVNIYVPINTRRVKGDATPFLSHLARVLPNQIDQAILLSYMAACTQYIGTKFKWAPLIQGAPGNGKTVFSLCVMNALGKRYTHLPKPTEIDEKYNDWLFNKLFIGVEDMFVSKQKTDISEILKPMITADYYPLRAMHASQVMREYCANFIFNANPKDAIRKTIDDRRFAIFFTAQQSAADLHRDGLTGSYFTNLYNWLNADGYAIVNDYLRSYAIPARYNPAGECQRAPETSSTLEAIAVGLGGIEQEILEAIDEGRLGFCGGWVSSVALDRLLAQKNQSGKIPINKRRELLQALGYDWHPGLREGRVNNPIMIDEGKKPRLFIKSGHIIGNISGPSEIAKKYISDQQGGEAANSNDQRGGAKNC